MFELAIPGAGRVLIRVALGGDKGCEEGQDEEYDKAAWRVIPMHSGNDLTSTTGNREGGKA